MAVTQNLSGNFMKITDAEIGVSTEFKIAPDGQEISINNDESYIELDLTAQSIVNIVLPEIASFNGNLNPTYYVSDKGGTVAGGFELNLNCQGSDTIAGQTSVSIVSKFSGMMLTPIGPNQWGTFYTTNIMAKSASMPADDEIVAMKKIP